MNLNMHLHEALRKDKYIISFFNDFSKNPDHMLWLYICGYSILPYVENRNLLSLWKQYFHPKDITHTASFDYGLFGILNTYYSPMFFKDDIKDDETLSLVIQKRFYSVFSDIISLSKIHDFYYTKQYIKDNHDRICVFLKKYMTSNINDSEISMGEILIKRLEDPKLFNMNTDRSV